MHRDELAAWLRLLLTPRLGAATARQLLAAFGLPQQVFEAGTPALLALLTPQQVEALRTTPPQLEAQVDATLGWLAGAEVRAEAGAAAETGPGSAPTRRVITLADADYPQALLQAEDPPLLLFVMGTPLAAGPVPWPAQALAVVGSRNPTPQGAQTARQFARSFASGGWTVVSGLALGIDAAAHEGALDGAPAGLATIAVGGTGLDRVYPRSHHALAHRIAQHGLLVSEYPLGTPPLRENFPRRNRLIAGLARGTLVVEAALQSGSLITARLAAEQGREVFAIPGSIHSPLSRGCHALIRQGAKLVETAQDVLDELAPGSMGARVSARLPDPRPAATVEADHGRNDDPLLSALGHDPVGFDALAARTGLPTPQLQARLLELELAGEVARLPGGLFQRQVRA